MASSPIKRREPLAPRRLCGPFGRTGGGSHGALPGLRDQRVAGTITVRRRRVTLW
jgi:hypothetical protein